METTIALIGEYNPDFIPHQATIRALEHTSAYLGTNFSSSWISTDDITDNLLHNVHGIWVVPGSPYKNLENTLFAIQQARIRNVPCFGTCGGFQHIILEFARNVLQFKDAKHAEYDPYSSDLFISALACSLAGRSMQLHFKEHSQVAKIYGSTSATEEYYCNFGVNPDKIELIASGSLDIVGSDAEGEVRVVELSHHPFFIGTLFVPQTRSQANMPHPLVNAFAQAAIQFHSSHH